MADRPAAVLVDTSGNIVGVVQDGAVYRLRGETKVARASDGAYINPATQETLVAIKDTDGIKKIVDQLPAGTNEIGKVAQGTKATGSGAWPQVLYDSSGNAVAVILDNSIYRLEARAKLCGQVDGAGSEVDVPLQDIDGVKHLAAGKKNIVDSNNSTTSQLTGDATFTGTGTDVSQFAAVAVTVHSDQDSADDGMVFEFSMDNTNWDDQYKFNLEASTSQTRRFQFPVCARYFRVRYVNGSTTTTALRIQTILQRQNILTSIHRVENVVKPDRSAQLVKSVIIAQREGAAVQNFYPVNSDVSGNLKVTTIGSDIPSNPSAFVLEFCVNGTSSSMLVNGSVTPVEFTKGPTATDEIWSIRELLLIFTADDFSFDGLSFGPNAAMTNGIKIEVVKNSVATEVFRVKQNEDFLRVPGRTPLVNNTGPKDVLGAALSFQGLVLDQSTGDYVRLTVQDDLTSVKLKYLTATLFAVKVE